MALLNPVPERIGNCDVSAEMAGIVSILVSAGCLHVHNPDPRGFECNGIYQQLTAP